MLTQINEKKLIHTFSHHQIPVEDVDEKFIHGRINNCVVISVESGRMWNCGIKTVLQNTKCWAFVYTVQLQTIQTDQILF